MQKWVSILVVSLVVVLVGVNGFLLFQYSKVKKNTNIVQAPILPPDEIILSGEVSPGWLLGQGYCASEYYIKTYSGYDLLRNSPQMTNLSTQDFTQYPHQKVNINGVRKKSIDNCGDYVEVVLVNYGVVDQEAVSVDGIVSCLPATEEESQDSCIKSLRVGEVYIAVLGDKDLLSYAIGDRLKVTGTIEPSFQSSQAYTGGINAFDITKIN